MTTYEIASVLWNLTEEYDEEDARDDELGLLCEELEKCDALRLRLERLADMYQYTFAWKV